MMTSVKSKPERYDHIVVGSGLSGLVFAALAASSGESVLVLEAHEHPGGYGHTFQMGKSAKFNAQLHYVWNCGEGETVNQVLRELSLNDSVTFKMLDPQGFDRMVMPDYSLKIPSDNSELSSRLDQLFPGQLKPVSAFLRRVESIASGLDLIASPFTFSPSTLLNIMNQGIDAVRVTRYQNSTLQDVFDEFGLDQRVQTSLASQWPDFLLPPAQLSFFAWVMLFTGYQKGAYYPTHHFQHVIDYSPSNFMVYCTVRDLDLPALGFGRWNTFHSGDNDLNVAFNRMYEEHDYSNPSFAITTPGLMTDDTSDRPDGEQVIELLTVADYQYFNDLSGHSRSDYLKKKKQIMNQLFDVVEEQYIPDFRAHLTFKIAGTPTTNERFCRFCWFFLDR